MKRLNDLPPVLDPSRAQDRPTRISDLAPPPKSARDTLRGLDAVLGPSPPMQAVIVPRKPTRQMKTTIEQWAKVLGTWVPR